VADEHDAAHRRIGARGIALPDSRGELLAEFGRRLQKGGAGGVVEHPWLVPPMKLRPGAEFVDHVEPRALVAGEAVDEDHRDPARLVRLEHFEMGPRAAVAKGLEKASDVRLGRAVEHVQQRRGEIGGKMGLRGSDADRGDLDGVREVEHRWGVIAARRAGELLQEVLVARHGEAEDGGGGKRLPRSREPPRLLRRGAVRHANHHRQPEAIAEMPPAEPLVVGLSLRLDRRDAGRIDGKGLRPKRHEHRPATRPHQEAAVAKPLVPPRRLEQARQRIGIGVGSVDQQVAVFGQRPGRVPRLLAGDVIAVHGMAVAVPEHFARRGEMLAGESQMPLRRLPRFAGRISRWHAARRHGSGVGAQAADHDRSRDDDGPQTPPQHGFPPARSTEGRYRPGQHSGSRFYGTTRKLSSVAPRPSGRWKRPGSDQIFWLFWTGRQLGPPCVDSAEPQVGCHLEPRGAAGKIPCDNRSTDGPRGSRSSNSSW